MPSKKPTKKSPGKAPKKNVGSELKDAELDAVAGGADTDPATSIPLEELDSRKRPGRVKSLHPKP